MGVNMKNIFKTATTFIILSFFSFNASAVTEIVWWDLYGGGDGAKLQKMVDSFNEQHPDINITKTTLEWGNPFYAKLEMASAIGEQPDIALYHMSRIQMAKKTGVFTPMTIEELSSVGINQEDYYDAYWNKGMGDNAGEMLTVPYDSPIYVMHYNKTLMEKAGLVDDDGGFSAMDGSPEKFRAALQKLKDVGVEYPISINNESHYHAYWWYLTLVKQFGGEIWTPDGGWCPGDGCLKAMKFYNGLHEDGFASKFLGEDAYNGFVAGDNAMFAGGGWSMSPIIKLSQENKLGWEYSVQKMPQLGKDNGILASHVHASGFMIPNSKDNPISDVKRKAVLKIIGWFAKNNLYWATAGHYIPYKPTAESTMYKEMWPSGAFSDVGEIAFMEPNHPVFGIAGPIYEVLGNWLVGAVNGDISAEEFIENTRSEINYIVDNM